MITTQCDICYGAGYTTTTQQRTKKMKCKACNGDGKINKNDDSEPIRKQMADFKIDKQDKTDYDSDHSNIEVVGNSQMPLIKIAGRFQLQKVHSGYKITAISNFPTARANFNILSGKYYYEMHLNSEGLMQIGFADNRFSINPDSATGQGVGDDRHSWAFDGYREKKWCNGSAAYGSKWSFGDIVGCYVDVDGGEISFALNGNSLGTAF
eukprot:UN01571